ncbi:F-box/kelch-repeat protein At3g23880-like [Bidens hawaiensis]|uniref:F-box/kelch-repeat protein At3g23880-like n=1 Tax=Bidens hawaiensis TaxID=980011 RepID=UPI004048F569
MADFCQDDLIEQILVRSEVKDLIRFRSVCKAWDSLITSPRFINLHFQHNYNKDRYNNELHNRRITSVVDAPAHYDLVGSSNGLVCLFYHYEREVLVGNPLTREVRQLKSLFFWHGDPVCRGFGYDSTKDHDYKVILGFWEESQTCVRVWSLKCNVWSLIGKVTGGFMKPNTALSWITKDGILCNGALHWIARDEVNMNIIIIAYDLSKDEFREISQPDDERYEYTSESYLAVIKEYYNVKESWELIQYYNEMKYDIVHYMKASNEYCIPSDVFLRADESRSNKTLGYIDAPVFVQSLISPYVNGKPIPKKRSANKFLPNANERLKRPVRSCRITKGDPRQEDQVWHFDVKILSWTCVVLCVSG